MIRLVKILSVLLLIMIVLAFAVLPLMELKEAWLPAFHAKPEDNWMAVLGDSSVTGAAAHPEIQASWPRLAGLAFDLIWEPKEKQKLEVRMDHFVNAKHYNILLPEPVTRVYYGPEETDRRILRNLEAKAAMKLDSEELTFGYLVGRRLGYGPHKIVVAGHDGAMLETLGVQIQRVLSVGGTLPPLMLISFVANDLCDPLAFNGSVEEFKSKYRQTLRAQLEVLRKAPVHAKGTRVIFLPPLDLANILSNPRLLEQKVHLNGDVTTCGQLRESRSATTRLSRVLQKVLINECPAVFSSSQGVEERLNRIKELQTAQLTVLLEETEAFQQSAPAGLELKAAPSVREIPFQTGDLANDCFHPSAYGHARIANRLLATELRLELDQAR